MNLAYPIQAILMYFAMLFAPDNVDRITLESPDPSKRIEMVRNGLNWSAEGNAFGIEGDILAIFGAGGKESLKIGDFVTLPRNHDWNKNPEFTLGGGTTLVKTATGLILRRNAVDGIGNGTYKIVYHQPETQVGATTVNVLGKVVNQGVHRISGSASVMTAIAAAGGPANGADMKRISIVRGGGGAVTVVLEFDLTVESGSGRGINAGDTVFVPALSEDYSIKTEDTEIGGLAAKWLGRIDTEDYTRSWKEAAEFFQKSITAEAWGESMTKFRKPLGAVKSRKVRDMKEENALPGAPDGKYWVIQFDTSFAAKAEAVETVTLMKQPDDSWKAAGYFIR